METATETKALFEIKAGDKMTIQVERTEHDTFALQVGVFHPAALPATAAAPLAARKWKAAEAVDAEAKRQIQATLRKFGLAAKEEPKASAPVRRTVFHNPRDQHPRLVRTLMREWCQDFRRPGKRAVEMRQLSKPVRSAWATKMAQKHQVHRAIALGVCGLMRARFGRGATGKAEARALLDAVAAGRISAWTGMSRFARRPERNRRSEAQEGQRLAAHKRRSYFTPDLGLK